MSDATMPVGWRVRYVGSRGAIDGQLTRVDLAGGRFQVGDVELTMLEWGRFEVVGPWPDPVFLARSEHVTMVVSEQEYDILRNAGARVDFDGGVVTGRQSAGKVTS